MTLGTVLWTRLRLFGGTGTPVVAEGLGYRVSKKPRPTGWDRLLANILQKRNAARKLRNKKCWRGAEAAHKVLQDLQRKVKQRIGELRPLELKERDDLLAKAKYPPPPPPPRGLGGRIGGEGRSGAKGLA